jgi:hypothetical protein
MLDEITRESMGKMQTGFSYDFSIEESGPVGQLYWACTVSDSGSRISAWIGVISMFLGLLGAVLGLIGLPMDITDEGKFRVARPVVGSY